ncbi:MAG: response regulator [Deltaproteobacteria bacterium]|nr:response regulator [Deltaproteobacteria bacterium]MBW2137655.1 response regulator [Deltaproteobacteria bacterium]
MNEVSIGMATEDINLFSYRPKILVVDDEKRIREGCRTVLAQEGFDVEVAEDGFSGLKKVQEAHFDLVLLDLMLPGIQGMDILEEVRAKHPDIVVIVITGYATLEHAVEAMKKGAFDFISKPFSPQDLRGVVGKAIEYIRTLQDIATEKSRMRVMINCLADGVMTTNAEKKVALANPAFLKFVGYRGENVIGKDLKELNLDPKIESMIDRALAMPKEEFTQLGDEVTSKVDSEKEERILGVWCVPFRDKVGRNLGTVTALHDITAIRKMDQLKSDFVSMVSHEIRSPLNTVLAQIKVIQDGLLGPVAEDQRESLTRISERLKSLVALSSELLDLAKIESGLVTQEREKLDLAEILDEQVEFCRPQADEKNILIDWQSTGILPPVLGNRGNIGEVFSNLLSNAIKYTPEGGRIKITAAVEDGHVRIDVTDTGIGIAEEHLPHIFDRFYRIKDDKTRFITGTGMGLAIVKSIVEAHNGMITVESKPDVGSTFRLYFPIASS